MLTLKRLSLLPLCIVIVSPLLALNAFVISADAVKQLPDFRCTMSCVWKSYDQICRDVSAQFTMRAIVAFFAAIFGVSNESRQMPSLAIICNKKHNDFRNKCVDDYELNGNTRLT